MCKCVGLLNLLSNVPAEVCIFSFHAGENAEKLLQFKRWFWSIVEKMSMTERQDLVSCPFPVETCRRTGIALASFLFLTVSTCRDFVFEELR